MTYPIISLPRIEFTVRQFFGKDRSPLYQSRPGRRFALPVASVCYCGDVATDHAETRLVILKRDTEWIKPHHFIAWFSRTLSSEIMSFQLLNSIHYLAAESLSGLSEPRFDLTRTILSTLTTWHLGSRCREDCAGWRESGWGIWFDWRGQDWWKLKVALRGLGRRRRSYDGRLDLGI